MKIPTNCQDIRINSLKSYILQFWCILVSNSGEVFTDAGNGILSVTAVCTECSFSLGSRLNWISVFSKCNFLSKTCMYMYCFHIMKISWMKILNLMIFQAFPNSSSLKHKLNFPGMYTISSILVSVASALVIG